MKYFYRIFTGVLFAFTLTGCIGEDYDVGVPTARLHLDDLTSSVRLKEANISWNTESENVQKKVKDIEKHTSSLEPINVSSGQKAYLEFEENEDNGGDIWTDPKITAVLIKDDKKTELQLTDSQEFKFPIDKGNYVLEVGFINSAGSAQYVGNITIQ